MVLLRKVPTKDQKQETTLEGLGLVIRPVSRTQGKMDQVAVEVASTSR